MPEPAVWRFGWLARLDRRVRRLAVLGLILMVVDIALIVARVAQFAAGAPSGIQDVTGAVMGIVALAAIGVSLRNLAVSKRVRHEHEAGETRRLKEAEDRREFLRLRAPDPAPGQCPVCGLEDLAAWSETDDFCGDDTGTALARVVRYGPDRAHAECAAVVPYTAQDSASDARSGDANQPDKPRVPSHFSFFIHRTLTYCACGQCERPDERDTVGRPGRPDSEPKRPAHEWYWHCKFCDDRRSAPDAQAAEQRLIEHARTCEKRTAVRAVAKVTQYARPGAMTMPVTVPMVAGRYTIKRGDGCTFPIEVRQCHLGATEVELLLAAPLSAWVDDGDLIYSLPRPLEAPDAA